MYKEIGKISKATVAELRKILNEVRWEVHESKVTAHQAANCLEQVKAVKSLTAKWPVDEWEGAIFLRLGPGGKLYRHADEGYGLNIPIETNKDAVTFSYENDVRKEQRPEVGKVYHADRSIEHESFNHGKTNRTHLLVMLK